MATCARAKNVRYIRTRAITIKQKGVLFCSWIWTKNGQVVNNGGLRNLDSLGLYFLSQKHTVLMNHAVEGFVKNNRKQTSFHKMLFYSVARVFLYESHVGHLQWDEKQFLKFAVFLKYKSQRAEIVL